MTEKHEITIHFDKILEIAAKGVRRAAVFTGLGINAARNPELTDFTIPGAVVHLMPPPEEVSPVTFRASILPVTVWFIAEESFERSTVPTMRRTSMN